MSWFDLVRPAVFALDPERMHNLTIAALKLMPRRAVVHDPILATRVAGIDFPSPIGLAAGFDKNVEAPDAMLSLRFGFVEVGTITPLPQAGNPRPRLFRLAKDEGVINRLGFNNGGMAAARKRLARRSRRGIVGANVGANKDSPDRIADYVAGVAALSPVADYITVNISSPNTPGLRGLQGGAALTDLLDAIVAIRRADSPPVFLKLAPDLDKSAIDAVVAAAMDKVAALIIGNTTLSRPPLASPSARESGGLSGAPLRTLAAQRLRDFRSATGGAIPLIAAGGIDSGAEAYARIRDGASLVQLYSALVYHGPGLASRIAGDLAAILRRDGFASVSEAVGVNAL